MRQRSHDHNVGKASLVTVAKLHRTQPRDARSDRVQKALTVMEPTLLQVITADARRHKAAMVTPHERIPAIAQDVRRQAAEEQGRKVLGTSTAPGQLPVDDNRLPIRLKDDVVQLGTLDGTTPLTVSNGSAVESSHAMTSASAHCVG